MIYSSGDMSFEATALMRLCKLIFFLFTQILVVTNCLTTDS